MEDRVSTGRSTDLWTTLLPNPCFYALLQVEGSSLGGPIHLEQLFGLSPSTRCHDCSELLLQGFAQVRLVSKCCNIAVAEWCVLFRSWPGLCWNILCIFINCIICTTC